jgi:hypothetical protein
VTIVRIAHADPRPGRMPDGSVRISRFLVVLASTVLADTVLADTVLADDGAGAHRAVAVLLHVPGGGSLWRLLDRPAGGAAMAGVLEETAARLLRAAGARVTAVDLQPTSENVEELSSDTVTAHVGLATAEGTRHVMVSAGYGLALAAATGAPVQVADDLMDRFAVLVQGGDLLAPFLPTAASRLMTRPSKHRRFEPRNMAFTEALDQWELAGSFIGAGRPHWQDYSGTTADGAAVLASAVREPSGFAVLLQTIFADDYGGRAVTFRGELRTTDVTEDAGLHLAVGRLDEPPGAHLRDRGSSSLTGPGSSDWTRHEVTTDVPGDVDVIRFGISLTGRGRIELRNAELTPAQPQAQQ